MSLESVNQVWLTWCCALHNWLLEIGEYNVEYDGVNQSSNSSFNELTTEDDPFTLQQLNNVTQSNLSGLGEGQDIATDNMSFSDNDEERSANDEEESEDDAGESDAAEENANTNVVHIYIDMEGANIVTRNLK